MNITERTNRIREIEEQFSCDCQDAQATRRMTADGKLTVWLQCKRCGRAIKSLKKSDYTMDELPPFDPDKNRNWYERAQKARTEVWQEWERKRNEQREEQNQAWWEKYNQYLTTQAWHNLRQRVMERDNHTCQACLRRPATQVHHLSYHFYNELGGSAAFECIAICDQCHQKIHPHMADAQRLIFDGGAL